MSSSRSHVSIKNKIFLKKKFWGGDRKFFWLFLDQFFWEGQTAQITKAKVWGSHKCATRRFHGCNHGSRVNPGLMSHIWKVAGQLVRRSAFFPQRKTGKITFLTENTLFWSVFDQNLTVNVRELSPTSGQRLHYDANESNTRSRAHTNRSFGLKLPCCGLCGRLCSKKGQKTWSFCGKKRANLTRFARKRDAFCPRSGRRPMRMHSHNRRELTQAPRNRQDPVQRPRGPQRSNSRHIFRFLNGQKKWPKNFSHTSKKFSQKIVYRDSQANSASKS